MSTACANTCSEGRKFATDFNVVVLQKMSKTVDKVCIFVGRHSVGLFCFTYELKVCLFAVAL